LTAIYTCVVKENVDMTVTTRDVGERPFDCIPIRHVDSERMPRDTDFLGDLRGRGRARVEYHDLRARRGECKRDRPSNTAAATSHDGNFTLEPEIRRIKHVCFPYSLVSNFIDLPLWRKALVPRRYEAQIQAPKAR
jgi:hypothetical protein